MHNSTSQTLGLVVLLLLVVVATAFAAPLSRAFARIFTYQHVDLNLNPLNSNFDPSSLIPHLPVPSDFITPTSPQQSEQTPNGVAITTDTSGNPLPEPIVVPGAGGDPQIAPGVG